MKRKSLISLFFLLLFVSVLLQIIPYDYLINILKEVFSQDGIIKKSTYLNYKHKFQFIKILFISIPVISILFLYFHRKIGDIIFEIINFIKRKIIYIYSIINIIGIFWFTLIIIVLLGIYALFEFDVGLDEAYYLNNIQNIEKYGAMCRDSGGQLMFLGDLSLGLFSKILVSCFGFSILSIRLIVFLFSLANIFFVIKIFKKDIGYIAVILIFLFPGIFYLTSAVFYEMIALFFVLLGLLFLKNYEKEFKKKYIILSAFFIAMSMSTKIQLFFWISLILFFIIVFDFKKSSMIVFKFYLLVLFFFTIIILITYFHHGLDNGIMRINFIFFGGNAKGALTFNIERIIRKTLILNDIIILPFLFFIWVKSWKLIKNKNNYIYFKVIYVGAILITLHWLLFSQVYTWRNVFVALCFNIFLLSLYIKDNYKNVKLILIPYIIVGAITNYGFIKNGVLDDVEYYREHVLDNPLSIISNNNQSDFFKEIKKIIKTEDEVYAPGQPFIPRLFLENREIKDLTNYEKTNNKSYLIITAGALKSKFLEKYEMNKYLVNSSKIVLQIGNYILYELN